MHPHQTAMLGYVERHKLTHQELADKLKCHRPQVTAWLLGRVPSASRLKDISKKLSIPIGELL